MTKKTVTVKIDPGCTPKNAAAFTQAAERFASRITMEMGNRSANAKSIMGVIALEARPGTAVTVTAEGHDENEALAAIAAILEGEEA